eukprot:COSAG01_NODE_53_length_31352_cov_23.122452_12_plen_81_part_00
MLGANGKIYAIPHGAQTTIELPVILAIDPEISHGNITSLNAIVVPVNGSEVHMGGKWWDGVLAPNGNIYGIPFNSTVSRL